MRKQRLGIILLLMLLAATAAGATSLAPTSEAELTTQATVIVVAQCTAVETQWQGRTLYTLATMEVEDAWKGDPGTSLTLALPGGVDLNRPVPVDVRYPGAPRLGPGEAAVLFLTEDPAVAGAYSVVGFNAGLLPLAPLVTSPAPAGSAPQGATISIDALRERILRHVAEQGGAR